MQNKDQNAGDEILQKVAVDSDGLNLNTRCSRTWSNPNLSPYWVTML